ncbi:microcephalin [Aulostomus maculatus]
MTTANSSALKDVVAYVDVWSSDKTANYSKPFIQQLHEMGAQVSKTFNKHVTHVVFNCGHPATWRKAKNSNVKLVSVLWVGRCYDNGVHVDEESYPALNDESNPVLKNKKHRCMQPKDSPARTPENDRRLRKKLDKMMKDLGPKQNLDTNVSPIIIDEKNGIVYSPAWKRSDYMAQRLKDMKEKRENLSPTASQMLESSSPPGLKPSLGSSPTVLKFLYDQSDEDSSGSVAEPGPSPDKEEGRTQCDVSEGGCPKRPLRKDFAKPWLSTWHSVSKETPVCPLKCPDFDDPEEEEGSIQKSRRISIRKKSRERYKSVGLLESLSLDVTSNDSNNFGEEKRPLKRKSSSPVVKYTEQKGKQSVKSFTKTKTLNCPDTVNSSGCLSPRSGDAFCNEASPLQKRPKRPRPSLSTLVQSCSLSTKSQDVASGSAANDDVFEDFFSPANHHKKPAIPCLPSLPIQIPFELQSVPKKRKHRRNESAGSEINSKKTTKLEKTGRGVNQQSDGNIDSHPQQSIKECLPAMSSPVATATAILKGSQQSTLPSTINGETTTDPGKHRGASTSVELPKTTQTSTLESRGNERIAAAVSSENPSDSDENPNKHIFLNRQKMVTQKKAMRSLVMTSMPTEKQHMVFQLVKALGGFSIVDRVCESTTHVVSGGYRRTLNILLGIARGCWILSFEWILWCLEQRQWIPEEPYELSEQFPAAQICRLQRHLSAGEHQQDLFQNQPVMFVSQHSQPPAQSLVELIQLCGGTVCKTVRQARICVGRYSGRKPQGSRVLSEQWVLDSITHLKRLPYDNYVLE